MGTSGKKSWELSTCKIIKVFRTVTEENKKFWTVSKALVSQVTKKIAGPVGACLDM